MNKGKTEILEKRIADELLPFVRVPSRYIGGEVNQIKKNLNNCDLTVGLCFPDVYEIGASHTGLAIIYTALNSVQNVAAERIYLPWIDAQQIMQKKNLPLFTLESKAAVKDLDCIGFSLTNEMCYTGVLNALDLAGIPLRSENRIDDEALPLIIGGAGMANCAEPVADFFDMFVLGQAEEAVVKLAEFLAEQKRLNTAKENILIAAAEKFEFVYVPSLYTVEYDGDKIKSFKPKYTSVPAKIKDAVINDFDTSITVEKPLVPFTQAVHERISIEVMRGCPGRCRFCQASFCRRPVRWRSPERIFEIAKKAYHSTGFDTISLLSLSTADYPYLEKAVKMLSDYFEPLKVGISLPSLKVDTQLKLLPKLASSVRKSGLTIAVEAAGEKVRKIINKPITNENLFAAVEQAYRQGYESIKLYFMVGLPGETEQDIKEIVKLSCQLAGLRKKLCGKIANINAAVSWFVPKCHTPFGRGGQMPAEYFRQAKQMILDEKYRLKARFVRFKFHEIERSVLESAVGRADRRMSDVIEAAYRNGARFDLWNECFDFSLWQNAFSSCGFDIDFAAQKQFAPDEILPWAHLGGAKREYLDRHLNQAMSVA